MTRLQAVASTGLYSTSNAVQRTVYERDLSLDVPQRVKILNSRYKAVCDNMYQFCSPYCKSEPEQDCSVIDEDTLDAAVAQNIKHLKQIKETVKFCQDAIIIPITRALQLLKDREQWGHIMHRSAQDRVAYEKFD